MRSKKFGYLVLTLAIGIAGTLLVIGLVDVSSAFAQEQTGSFSVQRQPPPEPVFASTVVFTDPAGTEIIDLAGNVIGPGTFLGKVRCYNGNCSQKVQLSTGSSEFEYKFTTEQALDPEERRLVAAGTGTMVKQGMKDRFQFTASFQDNGDGTISVQIVASRPDASFIIPKAPGWMEFRSLR
jgi:hypothetical protein